MNTLSQIIHQNNVLIAVIVIILGSFSLITWRQRWTLTRITVWLGFLAISAAFLFWLQSPSASISQTYIQNPIGESGPSSIAKTQVSLEFMSIEEIEIYLNSTGKPTLVEFYSDFGFS